MIPEIGNLLVLPKEFHNVTWYGRGPEENYIDRKTGYNVGLYQSTVEDFFVDYIKPLIQGDYQPIMVNGMPRHLVLNLKKGRKK